MKEFLIIFGGWTRTEDSYTELIKLAPKDWEVLYVPYIDEIKNGEINKLFTKVLTILDKKDLPKVNLLGHSLGGALAMEFTITYPEKVKRLILLDAEGVYANETVSQVIINFLKTHLHYGRKKALVNILSALRVAKDPITHFKLAKIAHHANQVDKVQNIKIPTVILWGEKDRLTPVWQGKMLHSLIPNSRLIILKNLDHDWPLHAPELLWQNI